MGHQGAKPGPPRTGRIAKSLRKILFQLDPILKVDTGLCMELNKASAMTRHEKGNRAKEIKGLIKDLESLALEDTEAPGLDLDFKRAFGPGSAERIRREQKNFEMDMLAERGSCAVLFVVGELKNITVIQK